MRICTLHANLQVTVTEEPWWLQLPDRLGSDFYTRKIGICRVILRNINKRRWVPPILATIPLKVAEREIVETIRGWDPDVIVAPHVRWLNHLQALLRRNGFLIPCVLNVEAETCSVRPRKRYDASSKVSIVLPTYNGVKYLRQSIESCLNQTHANLELIVVDDGSHENIRAVVDEFPDSRVIYIRHERNRGLSEALNTGFRQSTGEYLSWTSDDNHYDDRAIETMLRFLQSYPHIDFVYADCYIIDERKPEQKWAVKRNQLPDWLETDNGIGACYLYKRKVYESIGEFNPCAFLAEDYDYWIRVWKQFRMQRLFVPLYYYRFHHDSLTGQYGGNPVQEKVKLVKRLNSMKV